MKGKFTVLALCILLTGCGSKVSDTSSDTTVHTTSGTDSAPAEDGEDTVITMAVIGEVSDGLSEAINDFNAEPNGCRVEVKSYIQTLGDDGMPIGLTNEDISKNDFELIQDIINTDDIDIVGSFSFGNASKYEILKRKGAFADLYKFMEDDPEVNPSLLNSHILQLNEIDGKLYSMPAFYTFETLIGRTEYAGSNENWTIDEFIDHWDAMPAGSTVNGANEAENIYYDILRANTEAFVDYDSAQVNFDSPDFRKMLEFCKRFPSNGGEKGSYDYNAPRLVAKAWVMNYGGAVFTELNTSAWQEKSYHLKDGEYTFVGYPSSDGRGAYLMSSGFDYSICASSSEAKQRGAWEFIRRFYTEDSQLENSAERYDHADPETGENVVSYSLQNGFCLNNAARRKVAENMVSGLYDGENQSVTVQGHTVDQEEDHLEMADCEFLDRYMDSIDRWEAANMDGELFDIIEPEVMAYLRGSQDLDYTVDMIQNRASVWISEQAQ